MDFIKIWILLNGTPYTNPNLEFTGAYNTETGEIIKKNHHAKYKNFTIKIRYKRNGGIDVPNILEITGSLHYLSNNGEHNYNFFEYSNLLNSISELCKTLNIEPEFCPIVNLEYGVNIQTPINADDLLNNLLMHQKEPFTLANERGFRYKQCKHAHYIVKAYNKGKQFQLPTELMRFEIKYLKTYLFAQYGIKTLSDLTDISKLYFLHLELINKWYECILFEPPTINKNQLTEWGDQRYWIELKDKHRNKYSRARKKFDTYIINETANIKQQIAQNIFYQWCKFTAIEKQPENPQKVQIYTLNIGSNCTINETEQKCIVTGADISDQKKGSKFISAKKIGYNEAHKLRNKHSNPRNNLRRKLEPLLNQQTLFNNAEYIKLNEDQIKHLEYWNGTNFDLLNKYRLI